MNIYLNNLHAFQKGNFVGTEDLNYFNRELLKKNGYDLDLLKNVTFAKDLSGCDVYHFMFNKNKDKHVGIYNGKIEFEYIL